jgi:hypothetical protein
MSIRQSKNIWSNVHHFPKLSYTYVEDEIGRACSTHWGERKAKRILVGKAERKGPLERPRRRWENNIKTVIREAG